MVSERLGKYIEYKDISYYAFENSIGAGRGSISKAVKEGKSIGSYTLENILTAYEDLNPMWLLTGEGDMIRDDRPISELENIDKSENLNGFSKLEIINYISDHLPEFRAIKSFQLLLKSLYTDEEINEVRKEISELKKKVSDLSKSKREGQV